MTIRFAVTSDIPAMVKLSEAQRIIDAQQQPMLWRKAKDSATHQMSYYEQFMAEDHIIMQVSQAGTGINGFIIAMMQIPPKIYDLPGYTCIINEFIVKQDALWQSVGRELLQATITEAKSLKAVQLVVVSNTHNQHKQRLLKSFNLDVASQWHTKAL